jgi:homoserine kinase type II
MAVFTPVSRDELSLWLKNFSIGTLTGFEGIATGIENTNYFVATSHARYVLTLFEKLTRAELPFYLNLMSHLARHGIPCPAPIADHGNRLLGELNGKPAAIVTCLSGRSELSPTPEHCAALGAMLAEMHLAGQSFGMRLENPRGPKWWRATAPQVMPFLDAARRKLLGDELAFQASHRLDALPRGVVHADLFRDNVLFDQGRIGGFIDFYFAGSDVLLFDLAVCVNDWCVDAAGGFDAARAGAFLAAYHAVRALTENERAAWSVLLRAAALRFWLSRLFDLHVPRRGEIVHPHDPEHFRRILELRTGDPAPPWV